MKIYLCILKDRHYDDEYIAFHKISNAYKQVATWLEKYDDKNWEVESIEYLPFYAHASGNDYEISIEIIEVK